MTEETAGIYSCVAKNTFGTITAEAKTSIEGKRALLRTVNIYKIAIKSRDQIKYHVRSRF